jgi:hypothetical protein
MPEWGKDEGRGVGLRKKSQLNRIFISFNQFYSLNRIPTTIVYIAIGK